MHILHLNQRNQILFQYLRDKKKKKERRGLRKMGVKIHPFHLPWIRAWYPNSRESLTIKPCVVPLLFVNLICSKLMKPVVCDF